MYSSIIVWFNFSICFLCNFPKNILAAAKTSAGISLSVENKHIASEKKTEAKTSVFK